VGNAPKNGYDCSPDFNTKYRVAFLVVFLICNTLLLAPLYDSIFSNSFIGSHSFAELQAAHLLLVAANVTLVICIGLKKGLEYLGQVNMLALTVVLLLLPLQFLNSYAFFSDKGINNFYLGLLSLVIIGEYIRRMKYALVLQKQHWIVAINIISVIAFIIYLTN